MVSMVGTRLVTIVATLLALMLITNNPGNGKGTTESITLLLVKPYMVDNKTIQIIKVAEELNHDILTRAIPNVDTLQE